MFVKATQTLNLGSKNDLPPLTDEDWGKVHYAFTFNSPKGFFLVGIGDSVKECKDNALKTFFDSGMTIGKVNRLSKFVALTGLNDGLIPNPLLVNPSKYCIYLCEGKVFIYAKRWGTRGMKLFFDASTVQPYVRYAGYEDFSKDDFADMF